MAQGISLLLLRPHLLLETLHHLCIRLAMQLVGDNREWQIPSDLSFVHSIDGALTEKLTGEILVTQEVMDKVKGLESKLEYQIKKLVNLASAAERREVAADDAADGEYSRLGLCSCQTRSPSDRTLLRCRCRRRRKRMRRREFTAHLALRLCPTTKDEVSAVPETPPHCYLNLPQPWATSLCLSRHPACLSAQYKRTNRPTRPALNALLSCRG